MKLQHRILMSLLALLVVGDITQIVCKFIDKTNFRSNDLKRAADDDSLAKRGIVGKAVKAVVELAKAVAAGVAAEQINKGISKSTDGESKEETKSDNGNDGDKSDSGKSDSGKSDSGKSDSGGSDSGGSDSGGGGGFWRKKK